MEQRIETLNLELAQLRSVQQQSTESANNDSEEQLKKLRDELAQTQKDAEELRINASVAATLSNAPQEDGTKSVADQVAEHVAAVRAELESRHNERVEQNDERYKQKVKDMAGQLSKKLQDSKAQLRQTLQADVQTEHQQALQNLRVEHTQEIEQLQARHQNEMDELRRLEEAKFAQLKASSQKHNQPQASTDGTEGQKPPAGWQPSEQEMKSLIQSSDFAKGLLRANVTKQVHKTKEELTAQLKEEHEKNVALQISDLQSKADAAKEHAVALAGKKSALQLNLATSKAKSSQFKLDIVQKAAQDTPQKPVQEVWTVVKDAKPPAAPAAPPGTASAGQPQQAATNAQTPTTSTFGRPTPALQPARVNSPQTQLAADSTNKQGAPSGAATFGRPTPAGPAPQVQIPNAEPNQAQKLAAPQSAANAPNGPQEPAQAQPASNAPVGPAQGAQNHHSSAGTGPAALRGLSSGIPRGGSMRGNPTARGGPGIPRGRGSGIARGAPQSIDTSRAQGTQQGRGSPNSALNVGAKQFVPGNKRPREESQDGQGGDGKRIRGGGGGGGQ